MYSNNVVENVLELIDLSIDDVVINGNSISSGSSEWVVFSDEDADDNIYEFIKNSLWSFRAEFISQVTGHDKDEILTLTCEGELKNDDLVMIVERSCGLKRFVNQAIKADGRGHFLSTYDGVEREVKVDGEYYYVYRTN